MFEIRDFINKIMTCKYCNRACRNSNSLRNHERLCKMNPNRDIANVSKAIDAAKQKICACIYCDKKFSKGNIARHEEACDKNPLNIKHCPVCNRKFSSKNTTCSYSCANSFFKTGANNGNWNPDSYRTTCFLYHDKTCIVCGESNIVEVHHYDHDHSNNDPSNLIPLCPTHHQYVHSSYKDLVSNIIDEYYLKYKSSK